jgi:putative peptidoglycan lipid II flippase
MSRLFKNTVYVAIINLFGMALNFILNLVLASQFGISPEMDFYLVAISVPSYIVNILVGSLSVTFIPIFTDQKNSEDKWNLFRSVLSFAIAAGLLITVFIYLFSNQIILLQSPSLSLEAKDYCSYLLQYYSIIILLTVINEVFSGMFYAEGNFVAPMINRIFGPAITILIVFYYPGQSTAFVIVLATIIGSIAQTGVLIFTFIKSGYKLETGLPVFDKNVKLVFKLMLPLLAGSVFYKFLPVFDRYLLSELPKGSISIISYSQKLLFAITQVIGVVLSMQVFSYMSQLASNSNFEALSALLNLLVRLLLFVTIPVGVITYLFGYDIIMFVYQRGAFTDTDTNQVARNFALYSLVIPGIPLGTIISQGLYVLKDTKSPFYVGLLEVFVYIAVCLWLISPIGLSALPVAYVIYFYFSVIILGIILQRKIDFMSVKSFVSLSFQFVLLSGAVGFLFKELLALVSLSAFFKIIVIMASFLVYFLAAYFLRVREAITLFNKLGYGCTEIISFFKGKKN